MNPLGSYLDIVSGTIPKDLQTATAGAFISLKNAAGVLVVFHKAAGTAAEDPTLEFLQAKTVAGGSSKDLATIDTIYKKQGASLAAVGSWTKVTQTADEDFVGDGTSAEEQGLYAIWIPASALDRSNGFDCVSCNVKDVGVTAQLGSVLYIVCGLRFQDAPESLPSLIAD